MSFPFNVYLAAVVSSFAVVFVSLPLWRRWCVRTGLLDDPGHRKIHTEPIPLAGGLAVMTGLVVPTVCGVLLLWWWRTPGNQGATMPVIAVDPNSIFLLHYGLGRRGLELAAIIVGSLAILFIGWLDDKHELRPALKFAGQILVALGVAASGIRVTVFVPNVLFSYGVTILWILTVLNAFNFMDNMNGLCAGLGAIGSAYFGLFAAADGQYLVGLIAFLAFGSLLGFLPHNFPLARAFLGDSGSHLVGFLLAILAILPHFYNPRQPSRWAVLIPLFVLAVPLADLVQVVIFRWRTGKPFYVGDKNHLSHRLEARGMTRARAVSLLWLASAVLGALAWLIRR